MSNSIVDAYLKNRITTVLKYITAINGEYFKFKEEEHETIETIVSKIVEKKVVNSPPKEESKKLINQYQIKDEQLQTIIDLLYKLDLFERNILVKAQMIYIGLKFEKVAWDYDKKLTKKDLNATFSEIIREVKNFPTFDLALLIDINLLNIQEIFRENIKQNRKIKKNREQIWFRQEEKALSEEKTKEKLFSVEIKPIFQKLGSVNRFKLEEVLDKKQNEMILINVEQALWQAMLENKTYLIKLPQDFFRLKSNVNKLCRLTQNNELANNIFLDIDGNNLEEYQEEIKKLVEGGYQITTSDVDWIQQANVSDMELIESLVLEVHEKIKLRDVINLDDKKIYNWC